MSNNPNSFTQKHAELWKFIKFSIAGFSSTLIELAVYYILLYTAFKNVKGDPIDIAGLLHYDAKGVFWAFVISTTIGYIIAFILNRKTTFKADSNVALSATLYTIMVIFTIFATAWIGAVIKDFCVSKALAATAEAAVSRWNFIGDNLGKPFAATVATAWTYPLNRFVIHRKKKQK